MDGAGLRSGKPALRSGGFPLYFAGTNRVSITLKIDFHRGAPLVFHRFPTAADLLSPENPVLHCFFHFPQSKPPRVSTASTGAENRLSKTRRISTAPAQRPKRLRNRLGRRAAGHSPQNPQPLLLLLFFYISFLYKTASSSILPVCNFKAVPLHFSGTLPPAVPLYGAECRTTFFLSFLRIANPYFFREGRVLIP